jgi:hypothetical protein
VQLYRLDSPASPFSTSPGKVPGLPPLKDVPGKKRIVKDVLKVGTFKGWQVTPEILSQITSNFYEHKSSGINHPVCWGHGKIAEGEDTDERDSIDDIDDVWTDGKTLWMSAYVDPEDLKTLKKKRREVSVAVARDWQDATARKWDGHSLLHVAVVTHASVPGQEPFIELSAPLGGPMTFDVVVESMNKLAKAAGYPGLPETLNETNFNDVVPAIVDAWTGQTKKDDPMAEAEDKTKEAPVVEQEPVTMAAPVSAAQVETLAATVASLSAEVAALKNEKANAAKHNFESQVESALKAGLPVANKDMLVQLGADLKYSDTAFTTLNAFLATNKLTLGSQIGKVISADEPKVGIPDEDIDASLVAMGKQPRKRKTA